MANHEMQVGVFKAPLWSWLAFGISIVSFATHIIAFGMPEWVWYPGTYKGKAGIWLQCGGDSCTPHDTYTLEGKGRRVVLTDQPLVQEQSLKRGLEMDF